MKIGYARVSTDNLYVHLQLDALTKEGYMKIFQDVGIASDQVKPTGLDATLVALTTGDALVVWGLNRLDRSMAWIA